MPIIKDSLLPSFDRLSREGVPVCTAEGTGRDRLHIGLVNLMPYAALQATERQFLRLLGEAQASVDCQIHLFTAMDQVQSDHAHTKQYYRPLQDIKHTALDALIITGANPSQKNITEESFWSQILETIDWATTHCHAIYYSCLAMHIACQHYHHQARVRLPQKCWGVYPHQVATHHPLVENLPAIFDVPHSRLHSIDTAQAKQAGWLVLATGDDQNLLLLAAKQDQALHVYCQGHPEYDINSLLKEYKREIGLYTQGERAMPPQPYRYFPQAVQSELASFWHTLESKRLTGDALPPFPEASITPLLHNTWRAAGGILFTNWLKYVQQAKLSESA